MPLHSITKQVRVYGHPLPVYALPTFKDCHGAHVYVGYASSWTAAKRKIRAAGFRTMLVGGMADVCGDATTDCISIVVTVYPATELHS